MFRTLLIIVSLTFTSLTALADALLVGMSPDYPPLVFKSEGRIVGIEADNAKALGKILGRDMKLVEMPFAKLLPALQSGEIDVIMSGFSVTDERASQVLFTDAYMQMGQMAIMHKDKVARFAQPWSVYREGVRIGVEPGTTGAAFAERELVDAQISYFANPDQAFQGLRKDVIDLYIHDAPTSWQLANGMENDDLISLYTPLTEEMLAWAVRKDDTELLQKLDRARSQLEQNGKLRAIQDYWIPVKVEVQ